MNSINFTYFKYRRDEELPVYLRVDLEAFASYLPALLESLKFEQVELKESVHVMDQVKSERNGRILTLSPAGVKSSRQIETVAHSDRYGVESVVSKSGYKVYRFKGKAIIVYSYGAKEWECGVTKDFGTKASDQETKVILGRYLSWALAPLGLVGFWGVPVEEGAVILRQKAAEGEVVFFDIKGLKMLSMDGALSLKGGTSIIRLDHTIRGRNITMSREELFSFLSMNTSYLDPEGLSVAVRQLIHSLSLRSVGVIHPEESFRPRSEKEL